MSISWSNRRLFLIAALSVTLAVSACGFQPVYKIGHDDAGRQGGSTLPLYGLFTPDTDHGRALAAALRGRWEKRSDAVFDVTVAIDENARDSQLDGRGVASRIELDYVLRATVRLGETNEKGDMRFTESKNFVLRHSESMARSPNGAADLTQRRDLARLAMQSLAERLVLKLSQQMPQEVAP